MGDMNEVSVGVRSKKKLSQTQRNVILGVATVAGLGLVGKLLSVLRRERPTRRKDEDVETLESVLNGEKSNGGNNNVPLQAQVQRTKLANLDNDEPDHELVNNRKRNARRSKYADSFSEIISEDDVANEGQIYVSQDPVGRKENVPRDRPKEAQARDGLISRKGKQLSVSEGGGFHIKGMSNSDAGENRGKHHEEDHGEEHHEEHHLSSRSSKELAKKESTNTSGSSEKSPSTQKKHRRATSEESKQGRKAIKARGEEKAEKRKLRTHPEVGADKEVIIDEAGRWESVNGYKVLRATTSKIPTFTEAMHKLEADGSPHDSTHLMQEFERERAETEKAQSIWDGKMRTRKRNTATTESSEAYLRLKASVVSSVAGAEETPEGVKVREVVKRSTLLPIPSGDESEVHSSVYNVRETEKGLTVEEVVTRTKLLPAKGDFTFSDQQLLMKTHRKKPDVLRILPLLLRVVAVLVTLFSILLMLFSRKRIPLPFFY